MITDLQLRQMFPNAGARLDAHLPYIVSAMEESGINNPLRVAAFLAQLAHESGEYRYMEEIASGDAYEGRADLGNNVRGDGRKFKGHGPIQITGRANPAACGAALGLPLLDEPELIAMPEHGTRSAVWFWNSRSLSVLADLGWFQTITRIVNGGLNGWAERLNYYARNRQILSLSPYTAIGEDLSIKTFQRDHGLVVDGSVGMATLRAAKAAV